MSDVRSLLPITDDQERGLLDTEKYFRFISKQDWKQLREQQNAIGGPNTTRDRYASLKVLRVFDTRNDTPDLQSRSVQTYLR